MGRPLILTTLERDEAMRVLTGGAARRSRLAIACLAAGAVLSPRRVAWWVLDAVIGGGVAAALAASPEPDRPAGTDVRGGSAPGLIGNPVLAIVGVAVVAVLSVAATLAWIRLTGGRARR